MNCYSTLLIKMKNITELIIRLGYNYLKLDWKLTGDTSEI